MLNTYEHIGYPDIYITDPECLVVFYLSKQQEKIFGFHYCSVLELKDHILFRATELGKCSMVDSRMLETIDAKLITSEGYSWFHYDPENFRFKVSKDDSQKNSAD